MIEVHVEKNIVVGGGGGLQDHPTMTLTSSSIGYGPDDETLEEDDDMVEEPVVVTDQRVHFATFDAPATDPCDEMELPTHAAAAAAAGNDTIKRRSMEKIVVASEDATADTDLVPCSICDRTFSQKALERHAKICQKVSTTKRKVFDVAKTRTKGLDYVPPPSNIPTPVRKKSAKPEDDCQTCPHCTRKFGHKAFDRHVAWCEEKGKRLQTSPTKDMVALAKLHARTAYRPKTPVRKSSGGSSNGGVSPSRKESGGGVMSRSMTASITPTPSWRESSASRSNSRNENHQHPASGSGLKRTKSLGKSNGISFLKSANHTVETQDTHFIRATTGRGSIKRGPAPTKSSVLRQQAKGANSSEQSKSNFAGHEENCRMNRAPSMSSSHYTRASPNAFGSQYHRRSLRRTESPRSIMNYGGGGGVPQALVKPSVVRPPMEKISSRERREPDGIEHHGKEGISGSYDHSQEYDPYQSAARQMQELLFGSSFVPPPDSPEPAATAGSHRQQTQRSSSPPPPPAPTSAAHLRPSTNSAFQKYVPANVPSTADINLRLSGGGGSNFNNNNGVKGKLDSYMNTRRGSGWGESSGNGNGGGSHGFGNGGSSSSGRVQTTAGGAKVARFCHECGNPFALPSIRFCCECGVKRLYC